MAGFKEIDAVDLHALLERERLLLVDVRNDDEVSRGVIDGALNIPLRFLPERFETLGGAPLVFYCHTGIRSAQACDFMSSKGYSDLISLRGGIIAWVNAGFPISPRENR